MTENVLILSQRYGSDSQIIYNVAINESWKIWRFTSRDIPDWVRAGRVALYCETAFAEFLAEELNIRLLSPPADLLAKLPMRFLKRKVDYVTREKFIKPEVKKFIKPADHKYFPARIYDVHEDIPAFHYLQNDDPILISDVMNIVDEYRLFVLNHRVVTGSIYVENCKFIGDEVQEPSLHDALLDFCNEAAESIKDKAPSSYVMDVAKLDNNELVIIEFNPTWASGIYGADPAEVLQCIVQASEKTE